MGQVEMLDLKWYPVACSLPWLNVPSAGKTKSNSCRVRCYWCAHGCSSWKTTSQSCPQMQVVTLSVEEAARFERTGKICIEIQICLTALAIFKNTQKEIAVILLRSKSLFITSSYH